MVFMTMKKILKVTQLLMITLTLSIPMYAGEPGTGGGGTTTPDYTYDGGDPIPGPNPGDDGGDGGGPIPGPVDPIDGGTTTHHTTEIRYVVSDCGGTCSSGSGGHRHYSGCCHAGMGCDNNGHDGHGGNGHGDGGWRDRVECSSRYSACSQIMCESSYSEFRACERYEEDYEKGGRRGRGGRHGGGDCYKCSINNESTYAENVSAWMNPLAYITSGLGSAYLGYKGQKAWAGAYASGHQQCTSRFNSYLDYNITRGSNPILPGQAEGLLGQCNGSGLGGYAGMGGLSGNGLGGFGNPYGAAGYSGGFLGGMIGPYGGAFPGGGHGIGGGLSAGLHIGLNGGFGAGHGGGHYGGLHPGIGGFNGGFTGGMYPGGGGMYAGGAGLGYPGGFNGGFNGGFQPGGWNGGGNGSYWNNTGGWQGNAGWQQQMQQTQGLNNYANHVNQANYMTGQVAGPSLVNNFNQAGQSMYQGMAGPSAMYGATPYQQGPGFSGGFSYGVNARFGY